MGADKTVTIDLNPYLKRELVAECLEYFVGHHEKLRELFGGFLNAERFDKLLNFAKDRNFALDDLLELCQIEYIAPGDAADSQLPDKSIDFHTSYTVFEHIPRDVLSKILEEGNRIIRDDGLFVHRVDYSDHFSHSDKSISALNFLQFSDKEWDRIAGNGYMYMNRLRHDDYIELFESAGHEIVNTDPTVDPSLEPLLRDGGIALDERFRSKSTETLMLKGSWIVSRKKSPSEK